MTAGRVDTQRRTIEGLALPFGVLASRTSAGPLTFAAGARIETPADLRRVKLLVDHDPHRSVGYATAATATDAGLHLRFHVPEGPEGDDALTKAANGVRDGLSVGADLLEQAPDTDVTTVRAARLNEVSLVSLPAFEDARVLTVTAAQQTQPSKENEGTMTETTETTETPTEPAQTPASPATPTPPATVEASRPAAPPVPHFQTANPYAGESQVTLSQVAATVAQVVADGGRAYDITAALADVVPANDRGNGFIGREQWLGQLWEARNTRTPLLDSLPRKNLTGTKVKGWRWVTRPQVSDYAGNKTEIPTNPVETEPVEADVQRMAGGWDVDRIYVDLGDSQMVEALFTAAVEDYAQKLETKVGTLLQADSTPLDADGGAGEVNAYSSLTAALSAMAARAALVGASLSKVFLAPDVWAEFIDLTEAEVPWWMKNVTVDLGQGTSSPGGISVGVNPGIAAGTALGYDARAISFYRPAKDPLRVNAIDLPRGGIDLGVFGYFGHITNDRRALMTARVA